MLAGTAVAQGQQMQNQAQVDSVTDAELKKFVDSTTEIQKIQQSTQQEVKKLVNDEGMKFRRFQMIMMSKQNPQLADSIQTTQQEEQTIQKIQPQLQQISQDAQQQFVQAIQDEGLTPQRYQQIAQAVRTNPELSQRFQEIASDSSGSGG